MVLSISSIDNNITMVDSEENAGTSIELDENKIPLIQQIDKNNEHALREFWGSRNISKEQIIEAEADFIYGGWASFFSEKKFGSREQLQALDIDTYVQSASMKIAPTVEDVYTDIRNIAKIFRVEERGEELISQINADIDAVTAKIPSMEKPLDILVFDSGETEVYTAAQSFLNTLITMAGANNVFGDIEDTWAIVSKEDAVERSPEVIVITDYGSTTAEEKINFLKADPALSQTPAVQNERFVVLPLTAAAEGVRIAQALETLVKGFYPEVF